MTRPLAAVVLLVAMLGGCEAAPSASPSRSLRALGPGERPLPVAVWRDGDRSYLCAGAGFGNRVELRGSPDDPRLAWGSRGNQRLELVWPEGYSARFVPTLEVLDDAGKVIARDGDRITGGCLLGDEGDWLVSF